MTTIPDAINGGFEVFAGAFVLLSCFKCWKNKSAKGVSWVTVGFFALWGCWNLYFYPHLGQWLSFVGGISVFMANCLWVILLLKYGGEEVE